MVTDKWLTTTQAAHVLGVSRVRVIQLMQAGKLSGQMLNPRMWLIDPESLKDYQARQADKTGRTRKPRSKTP